MDKIVPIITRFWQNYPWIIPSLAIALALVILARKFLVRIFANLLNYVEQSLKLFWLNILKELIIEFWIRLTNPLLFKYYDQLRKYFSNQEASVFINPYLTSAKSPWENSLNQPQTIWYFLGKLSQLPPGQKIALITANSGKTKLLESLVKSYSKNNYIFYQAPPLIPFLLPLRKIYSLITPHNSKLSTLIQHFFQQQPTQFQVYFKVDWLEKYLTKGQGLILLDGLDEIGKLTHRQKVKEWIEQQIINYPNNIFIITARSFTDEQFLTEYQVNLLTIKPFDLNQIKQFLVNWYSQQPETYSRRRNTRENHQINYLKKADFLVTAIIQNYFLASLACHPLLLTLIAKFYSLKKELPRHKNELYAKIVEILLSQETSQRRYPIRLSLEHRQDLLQLLALELLKQKTLKFTLEEGQVILANKLAEIVENRLNVADFLELIKLNSNLIKENQGIYEFSHVTFQEYLAAIYLQKTQQEALILENISQPFWRETIIFYSYQNDVSALVKQALEINSFESLNLAYQCLEISGSVHEDVKKLFDNHLNNILESKDINLIKLAGEIILNRRLNKLRNEEQKINLDRSLITCAEYQLFINNQHQQERNRQPDHWNSDQFPAGQGQENITGIRASDAQEFCEWLTESSQEIGFRYRLPTLAEAEESPLLDQSIGYWCNDGQEKVITGIDPQQWSILNQKVADLIQGDPISNIIKNRTHNLDYTQILGHKLDLDLALNTARDTARNLTTELGQDPLLNRSLEAVMTQTYTQALVDRNLSVTYIKNLANTLEAALQLSSNITLDLAAIGSYLLLVSGFWYRLASFYQDSLSSVRKLRERKLNRKTCQNLVKKFTQKGDEAFNLYVFFLLIEERRAGRMSAWESIRIVRERLN